MKSKPPIAHPFLIGLYPVLVLFLNNAGYSSVSETLLPLAIIIFFVAIVLGIFRLTRIDSRRYAALLSLFLFLFFGYGHASRLVDRLGLRIYPDFKDAMLLLLCAIILAIGFLVIRRSKSDFVNPTRILNFTSAVLVLLVVVKIVSFKIHAPDRNVAQAAGQCETGKTDAVADGTGVKRDIYYIILDRYAPESTLEKYYDYDNGAFTKFLESKGFYVAGKSAANYHRTTPSLASSLNMEYINFMTGELGEDSIDWRPLFGMIQDYKVWRLLRERDYRFIHFGSGYKATEINLYADENHNIHTLPEFTRVLYETTMLAPIGSWLRFFDPRIEKWKRIPRKCDEIAAIALRDEPTYVFAHIIVPHFPFVFDKDGSYVSAQEEKSRDRKTNYLNQLSYTTKLVESMVERILANSSVPPIIIIQADEGPIPDRFYADPFGFKWSRATADEVKIKLRILNAMYLPGFDYGRLYPEISPVNTFRVVFDHYFDEEFELLPDKSYAFDDEMHKYKFIDVTDKVRD